MSYERRDFLRLFGVSAAICAEVAKSEELPTVEERNPAASEDFRAFHRSRVHNMLDVVPGMIYSSVTIDTAYIGPRYEFFTNPRQSVCDTNMYQPCSLAAPEMFCAKQVGFVFAPTKHPGIRSQLIEAGAGQLTIGQKIYWEQPLATCFRSKGDVPALSEVPDFALSDMGELPLIIWPGYRFGGALQIDISSAPFHKGKLKLWMILKGLRGRGIQ